MRVVVILLLLMSGDIETNPGPVGKFTSLILLIFVIPQVAKFQIRQKKVEMLHNHASCND